MNEKYRSIDLRSESAERLEVVDGLLREKWLGHIIRNIAISVVASIFLLVGIYFFAEERAVFSQKGQDAIKSLGDAVAVEAIKAPQNILYIIALGVLFLFLLYFIYSFFKNIIRYFLGPPKAGVTPEQTIEKYFMRLVPTGLRLHDWVDAYVCLLDQCKKSYGGYNSFISSWNEAKKALSAQIESHFEPHSISHTMWTLGQCKLKNIFEDGIRDYEVNLQVEAMEGINNPPISSAKGIGTVIVTESVSLAQIGDRWYVAQAEWNPRLVTTKEEEIKKLIYNFVHRSFTCWREGLFDQLSDYYKKVTIKNTPTFMTNDLLNAQSHQTFLKECFKLRVPEADESFISILPKSFMITNKCLYIYTSTEQNNLHAVPLCEMTSYINKQTSSIWTGTITQNTGTVIQLALDTVPEEKIIRQLQEMIGCERVIDL